MCFFRDLELTRLLEPLNLPFYVKYISLNLLTKLSVLGVDKNEQFVSSIIVAHKARAV